MRLHGSEGDNDSSCLVICCRICTLSCYLLLYRHRLCQAWAVGDMVLHHHPLPWVGWAWECLRCLHTECHQWGPTETNFGRGWSGLDFFVLSISRFSSTSRFPCSSWSGQIGNKKADLVGVDMVLVIFFGSEAIVFLQLQAASRGYFVSLKKEQLDITWLTSIMD